MDQKKNPVGGGGGQIFFSHQHSSQMGHKDLPQEAIGPNGSNCFSSGVIPEFLRKPIATCNFPRGLRTPCPPAGAVYEGQL